ncbi:protein phosphatase pp2a regulatory subunit b [Echinococcus multilocularis]|uniref:Serine/threonine-protein phosphatase 2A 55 kDa regulatory subunit B n=1 Tax=Echinococcus multilocularis TaxID=6211 RepID=A0A068YJ36_ECHMU|nr:protein phosphatase pp2a regulatory subunit b [Echinococcus multilocularis]
MNGVSPIPMEEDMPKTDLTWKYDDIKLNCIDPSIEGECISCVQFDGGGNFLAVGDRGGKINVFRTTTQAQKYETPRYELYCSFTSHESEFDYLKSLEIEEKINKIRWLPQQNSSRHLLSTNDKTIKLWRLSERPKQATGYNIRRSSARTPSEVGFGEAEDREEAKGEIGGGTPRKGLNGGTSAKVHNAGDLRVPRYERRTDLFVAAQPRRIFANAHAYHINSISVNSDQETFLSADDLRINLWNLSVTNQSFTIVDIKPANMEELSEVITAAEFHPTSCSLFMYSSSKGVLRLCDMRQQALCDRSALTFQEADIPENRGFFSEIVNSVTDLKFSNSSRYVLSRDYLTLKVWDMNMATGPVEVYHVHDHFRSKFVALYENDCIFDKFECAWSPDNNYLLTGSYNNLFRVFDRSSGRGVLTEAEVNANGGLSSVPKGSLRTREVTCDPVAITSDQISVDSIDFTKKLLHLAWHPSMPRVALASNETLFLVSTQQEQQHQQSDSS